MIFRGHSLVNSIDKMDVTELLRTKQQLDFRLNKAREKFEATLKTEENTKRR